MHRTNEHHAFVVIGREENSVVADHTTWGRIGRSL